MGKVITWIGDCSWLSIVTALTKDLSSVHAEYLTTSLYYSCTENLMPLPYSVGSCTHMHITCMQIKNINLWKADIVY